MSTIKKNNNQPAAFLLCIRVVNKWHITTSGVHLFSYIYSHLYFFKKEGYIQKTWSCMRTQNNMQ